MKKGTYITVVGAMIICAAFILGCDDENGDDDVVAKLTKAVVVLHPTEGNQVGGKVTFTAVEGGVRVAATIKGLSPGTHGFHIHEFGDCSSGDGKSAGGHFNPMGAQHGGPTVEERHVGDLGNIEADENGNAKLDVVDSHLAFSGASSVIGRGVIVHEKADDMSTQPTGAAGSRLACGVIGVGSE